MAPELSQGDANGDGKPDCQGINGSNSRGITKGFAKSEPKDSQTNGERHGDGSSDIAAPPLIAVVGMALRLPGGVSSPESFWELLINKQDARSRVPSNRYNVDAFHGTRARKGEVASQYGYFLEDSLDYLDASFFAMSKAEISQLDPQQRLLLEVVYECMESAGQSRWRGSKIGCYVGVFGEDWLDLCNKDTQSFDMYRISGTGDFAISNRISYEYNLKGPSMTIRTGCSSALVGLDEACQAIANGHCTSAIVAGTNIIISPTMTQHMTQQGVLSPEGSCKTFDAAADGYARGEAVNAVYIKRLDDALIDGDPIRAVIRSTFQNCDGKTAGLTNPSSKAHEDMIRTAYQMARLPVSRTAYIECHGTGTPVGDPLETVAIGNVFGADGVYIGSVKPNVGHSEGASGITSMIKAILTLEHRTIPPNIKFSTPNPKIPFEKANLRVPVEPTPWPADRAERVSVNSFGIGGANAHVVLDSAASFLSKGAGSHPETASNEQNSAPRLLALSANTADSLRRRVTQIQDYIDSHVVSIGDLAHTLALRREQLPHRTFGIVSEQDSVKFHSFQKVSNNTPVVNFVFTGQGAQWAGMGGGLMAAFPDFRADILHLDSILHALPDGPSWSLQEELSAGKETSRINNAEFSQPLCTALQIGLVNLLTKWGVRPTAVVGHSSGEIAAAYASKAISAEAAIIIAYYRGMVTKSGQRAGAMAAIGLGRGEMTKYLTDGVVIACENSPKSVTLSGDTDKLEAVLDTLTKEQPDVFCRRLKVELAYHSHHMIEFGERYESLMQPHLRSESPAARFYSSVYGKTITGAGDLDASYWRENMERPVLFLRAINLLISSTEGESSIFLEIGPHSALAGPLRQILQEKQLASVSTYISAQTRNENQIIDILSAVGQLFQRGVPIDFNTINGRGNVLTDLPSYPWQRDTSYWKESRITRNWRLRTFSHHELLGSRILESSEIEPSWRNVLHLDNVPWLRDHKILEDVVFPAAGYIAAIGEAIRQTTGSKDFSIRRLVVKNAFMLQEGQAPEVVTNFKPVALTDSLQSDWFDFTISTYNGEKWTKHCVGQARGGFSQTKTASDVESHPRFVPSNVWYPAMRRIGLSYGPCFQRLEDITTHPVHPVASARVEDDKEGHESVYTIHPTVIDQILQLFTVAVSNGSARRLGTLAIPAVIGELSIGESGPFLDVKVEAQVTSKGAIHGSAHAISNGKLVLSLIKSTFNPLETDSSSSEGEDNLAAAQLEWRPDINFLSPADLIRPRRNKDEAILLVEKLAILCMIETAERIASLTVLPNHLLKFRSWLEMEKTRMIDGQYHVVSEAKQWITLPSEKRFKLLHQASADAFANKDSAPVASVVRRILDNCDDVFHDRISGIELLLPTNGLASIYTFYQDMVDFSDYFQLLGHSQPTLQILEVGAGTGGTTAWILEALQSAEGVRMFSKYHYTDVSPGFFPSAKERFKQYTGIEYSVLDISEDVCKQGFEPESYDIVIASNVLHATSSLHSTLINVRKLIAPGGRLFLQELNPKLRWTNYVMGILPGWWLGQADERPHEPFVSPSRWNDELRSAGFSGVDSVVYDNSEPLQINANIVSTAVSSRLQPSREISLLCCVDQSPDVLKVAEHFAQAGYTVTWITLDQEAEVGRLVIVLLDLESPFLYQMSAGEWSSIQTFFSRCSSNSNHVIWVTRSAQLHCSDPSYSLISGFSRSIRSELSLDLATFEIDCFGPEACKALVKLSSNFEQRYKADDLNPEYEYAFFEGQIHTSRFHWISSTHENDKIETSNEEARLGIGNYGLLGSLAWETSTNKETLQNDEVEVEIRSVGLNFRDVLVAMGIVDGPKDRLGLEGSGVITRTSPNVNHLHVGDRVFVCDRGCLSTKIVTSAKLCGRIPDTLSFEDAATMPCVYSTVIHSLINIGGLENGQSVLIHSACGGVGIAAIQICQMLGAEIYTTVGSEEKIQYLNRTFKIPRHRVFDSRSTSFLPDLMLQTNGKGVDFVLNSLSGELLHASWKCVAPFGKMLEIGKRDFIGHAQLSMNMFEANRTFVGIDLAQIISDRPQACQRLLEQCLSFYREGYIDPIRPMKVFDATEAIDAFRYMQKGQHIGKIVINMPESTQALRARPQPPEKRFSANASYLLVGGLGGLGRAISTWMVERGARHLIYLSRSAGTTPEDKSFLRELEAQSCSALAIAGSVTCKCDIQRVIELSERPIAGVMQLSMVLRDQNFLQMTYEEWKQPLSSKVHGTYNLHDAFKDTDLDFFLLFSSLSGTVGQWGQCNYAAANTFLDSFVQYRHSLGLPASVIDVGVMEDVGYVSQNAAVLEMFRAYSMHGLRESDLLRAIEIAIQRASPCSPHKGSYCNMGQLTTGLASTKSIVDPSNRAVWKHDMRTALYRHRQTERQPITTVASDGLKALMASVALNSAILDNQNNIDFLTQEIGKRIRSFMIQSDEEVDIEMTLSDLGVDSLVSIEIRNWWKMGLGLDISVLEIMSAGSIRRLGAMAVDGLRAKFSFTEMDGPHPGLAMKAP